jgi:hypothetical protein
MMDRFQELLDELGAHIRFPLHVGKNRSCGLNINDQIHIQLTMNDTTQSLLVVAFVAEVPLGRYREELFKEALKHNDRYPRPGVLSFMSKVNQLTAFEYLPIVELNGVKLAAFLGSFIPFVDEWHVAVAKGLPGPRNTTPGQTRLPSPFELRP